MTSSPQQADGVSPVEISDSIEASFGELDPQRLMKMKKQKSKKTGR
jgi:hypothetical protein